MSVENLVSRTAQHFTEARTRLLRYNMSRCLSHSNFLLIGQAVRRARVAPPPNTFPFPAKKRILGNFISQNFIFPLPNNKLKIRKISDSVVGNE